MANITEFKLNPLDGSTTTEYSDGVVKSGSIIPATDLTGADVARLRAGAVFRDDFRRANTSLGQLGAGWVLKGAYVSSYPLPAATDGQILGGVFVAPGGQVVYATRQLKATPTLLRTRFSWADAANGLTQFRTIAAIISSSANIIDTMLHITLTNNQLRVQKRVAGGAFINLADPLTISPSLVQADTPHILTLRVDGNTCTVTIDDAVSLSVTDADMPLICGPYICVEHYSAATDVRWPLTIYEVEAA